MDPNTVLYEIREYIKDVERGEDVQDELAERFTALDEWITKGGFLPADWAVTPGND